MRSNLLQLSSDRRISAWNYLCFLRKVGKLELTTGIVVLLLVYRFAKGFIILCYTELLNLNASFGKGRKLGFVVVLLVLSLAEGLKDSSVSSN